MKNKVDIIIRDATIITVDKERRVITNGSVAIEKDRIKDIGKSAALVGKYEANRIIDGSGKLVMPE